MGSPEEESLDPCGRRHSHLEDLDVPILRVPCESGVGAFAAARDRVRICCEKFGLVSAALEVVLVDETLGVVSLARVSPIVAPGKRDKNEGM